MNRKNRQAAMIRYGHYCKTFISLADQAKQLEQTPAFAQLDLNFDEARVTMRNLLQQMLANKPDWA